MRLLFDAALVEEAVLRAIDGCKPVERHAFHAERDAIYGLADPDERERRFQELHGRWFARLALARPVEQALDELIARNPPVDDQVTACRVVRATARREEMADLADEPTRPAPFSTGAPAGRAPGRADAPQRRILARLTPEALLDSARLLALLRHEFLHIADMLDPGFGYDRALPAGADSPSREQVLRDRYRVLWDTTIDGRLCAEGRTTPDVQPLRRQFEETFAVLGEAAAASFERWLGCGRPTHGDLMAFALDPAGMGPRGDRAPNELSDDAQVPPSHDPQETAGACRAR